MEANRWRNAELHWHCDVLSFWIWSHGAVKAADFPRIAATDDQGGSAVAVPLSTFSGNLPARQWTRIAVPFGLHSESFSPVLPTRMNRMLFSQNGEDGKLHMLYLDEIRVDSAVAAGSTPSAPVSLSATEFERHVDLEWQAPEDAITTEYVVYRPDRGGPFHAVSTQ